MSEENNKKLNEQLLRCVLDDKLSNDVKLRKVKALVGLGSDVNAECGLGFSVLSLAKMMNNNEIASFLEKEGAKETEFNSEKAANFFKTASVDEMNNVLRVLPDGFVLDCYVLHLCRFLIF